MSHADEVATAVARRGLSFLETKRFDGQPFTFAIYADIPIDVGRFRGTTLSRLALPIPDDPMLPPPGIHTMPHLVVIGERNVHGSPLGAEWAYWSRPIPGYTPAQGVPRILSHLQSIFRDA